MKILVELEVPDSCANCPFANETEGAYHDYCTHPNAGYSTYIREFLSSTCDERPGWCPFNTVRDVVLGEMIDDNGIGRRFKINDEYKLVPLGRRLMKLREPVQRYEVGKHGSEYIDYSGPAMICPECQGTNVREIGDEETGRNGDYLCKDCGCEFDTWIGSELTSFGKFMGKFTKAMVVIFVVLAFVCLIAGAVYLFHLEKVYGYGNTPAKLDKIGFIIMIGGLVLFLILAGIVYAINERI